MYCNYHPSIFSNIFLPYKCWVRLDIFDCVFHVNIFTSVHPHLHYTPLLIFAPWRTLFYLCLWWFNALSTPRCIHAASDDRTNNDNEKWSVNNEAVFGQLSVTLLNFSSQNWKNYTDMVRVAGNVLRFEVMSPYTNHWTLFIASVDVVFSFCIICGFKHGHIISNKSTNQMQQRLKFITCRLTLRRLMSYIYGAPILDVSRSHTTTQHSQ